MHRTEQKITRYNNLILIGYSLLAASLILYGLFEYVALKKSEQRFTVFVLHYLIALGYTLALLMDGSLGIRKSWRIENIDKTVVLLNLFLISAYALNRELPVFASSTSWLCVYLFVTSLCMLSYRYFSYLNIWINRLQHIVLGSAIILYIYLAVYVAHVYAIGTIGILFFGIGGHVFVPLIFFTACVFMIRHVSEVKQNFLLLDTCRIVSYFNCCPGFYGRVELPDFQNRKIVQSICHIPKQRIAYLGEGCPGSKDRLDIGKNYKIRFGLHDLQ